MESMPQHATAPSTRPSPSLPAVLAPENLARARRRVVANRGAPGADGMSVEELDEQFDRIWPATDDALRLGDYRPSPLREVEIAKPDGGKRLLRIPSAIDRVVLQAIAQILNPVWDPSFSPSSFAYRTGRGALEAVTAARERLGAGIGWVVHLDIVKCFDNLDIRAIAAQLSERIGDQQLLKLLDLWLAHGSRPSGAFPEPERPIGIPQGSPLSPLLANLALDPLDRFLESRNIPFARYADDAILFASSSEEAGRFLKLAGAFLRDQLLLELHPDKSVITAPEDADFLGFTFTATTEGGVRPGVSVKSRERFRTRLSQIISQSRAARFEDVAGRAGEFVSGWLAYYGSASSFRRGTPFRAEARRQLRAWLWNSWETAGRRQGELVRRGVSKSRAAALVGGLADAESACQNPVFCGVFPNSFFSPFGLGEAPSQAAPVPRPDTLCHRPSVRSAAKPTPGKRTSLPDPRPIAAGQDPPAPGNVYASFCLVLGRYRLRFRIDANRLTARAEPQPEAADV